MLQVGGDLDLAQEAVHPDEVAARSGCSTLSATWRSCLMSCARQTVAMPPWPEFALDGVAVGDSGGEALDDIGHRDLILCAVP